MNKTFRNLALSLAGFTMSLVLLPQTVFAGETTAEDYVIEKDEEQQTCKITGYTGSSIKPDIPDIISGYKVISIGSDAFKDSKVNITSVELPKYIESLDDKAFEGCEDLVTVKFDSNSSVTSLGAFAFNKCKSLTSISIPTSVTSLGEGCFMQCSSMKSITIPSGITDIPVNAFAYDIALNTVSLSNNVKTIGENAFNMCAIEKIKLPKSLETIGKNAFYNSNGMEVTCLGAIKSIDDTAFDVDEDHDKPTIRFIADGNNPGDITRFAKVGHVFTYVKYYYQIAVDTKNGYGNISISGTEIYNGNSYLAGDTITLRLYPGKKYRLVKWAAESTGKVNFDSDILETTSFRMPAANVKIVPEFVELFNVNFYDEDGTTLLYKDVFAKGETVVYRGARPTKSATKDYIYKFDHWSPELGQITADASYKAVYKEIEIVTQIEPTYTPVPSPVVTVEPTETPVVTNTPVATATPTAAPTVPAAQQTGFVVKGKTAVFTKPAVVNANKVTIPATVKINGKTYKVTEIKDNAFKGNKDLTQITIGKNITKIGKNAFNGCKNLKKVTFKSTSVTKIGKGAFKGINKKAKFTLPKKKAKVYKKLIKKAGFKI